MIDIDGVCKSYKNVKALDNFSLHIDKGELFGLIGPNGAGKTTFLKILAGLLNIDEGKITIDGNDMQKNRRKISEIVGYMPDFFGVYDNLKVMEYMEFYCAAYYIYDGDTVKKINNLLERVGLLEKADMYVDQLSRGMKQRLCLARTLLQDPPILVLDEPYSGLDVYNRNEMKRLLRELSDTGKTIIVSSHILNEMTDMCTSLGVIKAGRLVLTGNIDNILEKVNNLNPLLIEVVDREEEVISLLKKTKEVKSISINGRKIQVEFDGNNEAESILLKNIIDTGAMINFFGREQRNLEGLFMDITKKEKEKRIL
ncbi:MAG: ABC transporter ATP-binding protein [Lachnospiraceae bacterium]|uniref:ABC transporter ATP-binding protein n=1 Tax=Falcatimonas sp. MSJ-15 TaxID=2841515 RepID=UPI001C11DF4B|nr:ABC transporter ATP-binding protein [Falcatimonas sp. MSJ-15]MEE0960829.1 ABC transporter ATP-binding protein [Lachnospiraceae bacterium]